MKTQIIKNFNSKEYGLRLKSSKQDKARIEIIKKLIGKNRYILDVGCEEGEITKIFEADGNIVDGVEISAPAIKLARKKGVKVYEMDLECRSWNEKIKKRYDAVFAGEVIEHIYDTENFLKNIRSVLRDNGELIITTPNLASLGRRILLFFGKNPLTEISLKKTNAGHIRYFTFTSLSKLLNDNGFEVIDKKSTRVNFDINGKLSSAFLANIFPTFGSTIIVKVRKT